MLSNAYFHAKFRFDTAENEPAKNLQKFANFANFANSANPNRPATEVFQARAGGWDINLNKVSLTDEEAAAFAKYVLRPWLAPKFSLTLSEDGFFLS